MHSCGGRLVIVNIVVKDGCDLVDIYAASWRQDGRFVPNITIGPLVVDALRPVTDLPLDVHLVCCWAHRQSVSPFALLR